MGQKVNPHGMRIGIVKTWDANWYADKQEYVDNLHEDIKIRKYLMEDLLKEDSVSKVETERSKNRLKITIHTAKPSRRCRYRRHPQGSEGLYRQAR